MTTDFDAKKAFSNYHYKNLSDKEFPVIYIDEYWEYYIDMFGLRDAWDDFLPTFKKEFPGGYLQFEQEVDYVIQNVYRDYFTPDANEKLQEEYMKRHPYKIPIGDTHNISGKFIKVDLHCASGTIAKYIGITQGDYNEIIGKYTQSSIIKNSKIVRYKVYKELKNDYQLTAMYEELLMKVYNNTDLNKYSIAVHHMDALFLNCPDDEIPEGDYVCEDIPYSVSCVEIKHIKFGDRNISYFDHMLPIVYKYDIDKWMPFEYYPMIWKKIHNQPLNEKDLVVGYENQIFFKLDEI